MGLSIYSLDINERLARIVYGLYHEGKSDAEIARILHVSLFGYKKRKKRLMSFFPLFDIEGCSSWIEEKDRKRGLHPRSGLRKLSDEKKKECITLSSFGVQQKKICEFLRVDEGTLIDLFKEDPAFYYEMRDARMKADIEVLSTMRKRATGYTAENESESAFMDAKGKVITKTKTVTKRHIEPSDKMLQFMMINRHGWSNNAERQPENHDKVNTEYDVRRKLYGPKSDPRSSRNANEDEQEEDEFAAVYRSEVAPLPSDSEKKKAPFKLKKINKRRLTK